MDISGQRAEDMRDVTMFSVTGTCCTGMFVCMCVSFPFSAGIGFLLYLHCISCTYFTKAEHAFTHYSRTGGQKLTHTHIVLGVAAHAAQRLKTRQEH